MTAAPIVGRQRRLTDVLLRFETDNRNNIFMATLYQTNRGDNSVFPRPQQWPRPSDTWGDQQ